MLRNKFKKEGGPLRAQMAHLGHLTVGKSTQRYIVMIGNVAEGVTQRYTMQKVSTNQNENDAPILDLYRSVP